MKFGVPWNVKGVRPEVRDSARQAARRSGMSVGEWLNHVIAERATTAPETTTKISMSMTRAMPSASG